MPLSSQSAKLKTTLLHFQTQIEKEVAIDDQKQLQRWVEAVREAFDELHTIVDEQRQSLHAKLYDEIGDQDESQRMRIHEFQEADAHIDQLIEIVKSQLYDGFREAADEIDDQSVAELFRDLAAERSALATELQGCVEWNGEEAEDDGSVAASVHRAWINVRAKLNGGDAHVILIEAERGEDHIKHAYEEILKDTAGSAMNDVLQTQYARVKAGHDRVRDLRDAYKNKK